MHEGRTATGEGELAGLLVQDLGVAGQQPVAPGLRQARGPVAGPQAHGSRLLTPLSYPAQKK